MHQESIILSRREMYLLQDVMSSNFSQVWFRLSTPVNLRPNPFSPTRRTSFLSTTFTTNIFPVSLSLNLSPIFKLSTVFFTTPSPLSTSLVHITLLNGELNFERLPLRLFPSFQILLQAEKDLSPIRTKSKPTHDFLLQTDSSLRVLIITLSSCTPQKKGHQFGVLGRP